MSSNSKSFGMPPEPRPLSSLDSDEESFAVLGKSLIPENDNTDESPICKPIDKSIVDDVKHLINRELSEMEKSQIDGEGPPIQPYIAICPPKLNENSQPVSPPKVSSELPMMPEVSKEFETNNTISIITLSSDLTSEETPNKIAQIIDENVRLKDTILQNNMSLKLQYKRIKNWQDEVQKVHQADKDKILEAKVIIDKLKCENIDLRTEIEDVKKTAESQCDELNKLKCAMKQLERQMNEKLNDISNSNNKEFKFEIANNKIKEMENTVDETKALKLMFEKAVEAIDEQFAKLNDAIKKLTMQDDMNKQILELESQVKKVKKIQEKVALTTDKSLVDEEWFHGVLPREEVVRLLTQDGDFLVRETIRNDESQTVLSVCWGGDKHFIVQTTAEGHYRFESPAFPSIRELILYQFNSGLPVTSRSKAILHTPIPRERWELKNDDVILLDKVGKGNVGDVYTAQLKNNNEIVAVKTCRVTLPEEHKRKLLQEGRTLKQYDHPNIVKLIGICVQKQPVMIVMELVPRGSLLTFLKRKSNLSEGQLMKMCLDVADGMRYLESKNCIHRDLAARNCLVGYNNIVKISEFGMSREEEEYIVSDGMEPIPIKWTAPEALNFGKYTSLCDVWSYGILCWEIFSRGDTPYCGMSNSMAKEKIDNGYRMPAPENTPEEMYRLMLRCWEYQPENRPNFEQIYTFVETLCATYLPTE